MDTQHHDGISMWCRSTGQMQMVAEVQVFSNVRSAPVPVTVKELLTSQPLHEASFRDAGVSHQPVALGALRFLGEWAAHTFLCCPRTSLSSGLGSLVCGLSQGMQWRECIS